jgi:hypothetical protein
MFLASVAPGSGDERAEQPLRQAGIARPSYDLIFINNPETTPPGRLPGSCDSRSAERELLAMLRCGIEAISGCLP